MSSFIAANLAVSAYNMLFVIGMWICMAASIPPPLNMWWLAGPWIVGGIALYVAVLRLHKTAE
jgi:hypothetical protein